MQDDPLTNAVLAPPRSGFVTAIGWLGVVFGAMGILVSLLQLAMLSMMFPDIGTLANDPQLQQMPPLVRWIFEHFALFIGFNAMVCLVILVASIGLLKRRNWARLTVVGLLVAGVLANVAGLVLQQVAMGQMAGIPGATAPPEFEAQLATMRAMMLGVGVAVVAVIALIHGAIAWKLLSAPVRREFGVD